jgi:hypothetical protein
VRRRPAPLLSVLYAVMLRYDAQTLTVTINGKLATP